MESVDRTTTKYVKIYKQKIINNIHKAKKYIDTPVMAVVKSNAYGHDLKLISPVLQDSGVSWFGVSTVDEGIALREIGIDMPILLLADPMQRFEDLLNYDITPTLSYFEDVKMLEELLSEREQQKNAFIAIDTGMGRYGFIENQIDDLIQVIKSTNWISYIGASTHLSSAADKKFTGRQLDLFNACIEKFRQNGIEFPIVTAANSLAAMDFPESRFNLVRLGNIIYGEKIFKADISLEKTWDFMVKIIRVRDIPSGSYVGYGHTFKAKRDMKLGILDLGYYDGFSTVRKKDPTIFINFAKTIYGAMRDFIKPTPLVYFKDKPIKIVGQVSMQLTCIDLTDTDAQEGDFVRAMINPIYIKENIPRKLEE
ncbi:MAG: alanine racemase [Clostridia bacterium]|nr:alanine racemase [Clostridia bacterium]